ncbi:MAG: TIGR02186 family protein [Heliomarina sp.]|uniref:TIGR02186 family protein n=1 Tax=Heliomarina sp. TaxID=2917556 RepID=UPI00405943BD
MRFLLLILLILPIGAAAESVVLGLSRDRINITANFDGSEILVFGAVKREVPISDEEPLEVIVTVAGPSTPVVVRRKDKRYGIWVNNAAVEVDAAPSFYAVATSGPLEDVLLRVEDLRHKITTTRAIRSVGAPDNIRDSSKFTDALIRVRQQNGLYQLLEGVVSFDQQTLFNTSIRLPANLTEGGYTTRIFLTRGGAVVSDYEATIFVGKVGLERWLYALSRAQPMVYGIMSITIAVLAGWGASAAFRLLRNS